jgi:hypothetical protein
MVSCRKGLHRMDKEEFSLRSDGGQPKSSPGDRGTPAGLEPGTLLRVENQAFDRAVLDFVDRVPVDVAATKLDLAGFSVAGEEPLFAVAILEIAEASHRLRARLDGVHERVRGVAEPVLQGYDLAISQGHRKTVDAIFIKVNGKAFDLGQGLFRAGFHIL